ncbi:fimbria/pilus outer membrane usher protein [Lysobacter sp. LF1]|uniref:Fimbria/pilus outer membrane usher protein n=1 Tax=Lysobacter stagni TaxID=3045172 RepID=A0ABT6XLC0_9GAMM|nr:fimbria/pilus outer membrane usher protein [Lysobacter sp. LF1]MDI9240841.1 fimbria/pilus outer membrane usher protein [Lysobacter sp. LF1]
MSPLAPFSRSSRRSNRRALTISILTALGTTPVLVFAAPSPEPSPGPQSVEFSSAFLSGSTGADLSRFERGNPILPGNQSVDVFVNDARISRQDVLFRALDGRDDIQPCFTIDLLDAVGVDTAKLEGEGVALDGECLDLRALIPDARVLADAGDMSLRLSIPQIYLRRNAQGYVDPKLWDRGVTALTLGYSFNVTNTDNDVGGSSRSAYLGLNTGLNVAGWRIRNQSYYSWNRGGQSDFTSISTYAQHDIDRLRSQLTVGDTFTTGQIFDSLGFRGVSLATDDRMLPDSMTGYAPIVRGVAQTNATVEIRQAGYVIYRINVAPGPFEITDLPPAGFGGDLEVVVTETDGRQASFTVPFAAVPQLLRPGTSRYSAVAGEVRNDSLKSGAPSFLEATYQRGINNWMTAYGGIQSTEHDKYRSAVVGAAFNTPVGAVSLDVTGSRANFSEGRGSQSGYSARATYSKNIPSTQTNFALAAYRYSSRGYLTLDDAAQWDDQIRTTGLNGLPRDAGPERNRFSVTMSQNLGSMGTLNVSGSRYDYWSGRDVDTSYQIGWSKRFRSATFGVNAARSRYTGRDYDNTYSLALTVPLGRDSHSGRAPMFDVAASQDPYGNNVQARVNGIAGARNQYNYGVTGNFGDSNKDSVGVHGGWRGAYGTVNGAYTYGTGSRSASLTAQGGLVVHSGGITLAPQVNETMAILNAADAKGARLSDGVSKIDRRGYAVMSSLTPYRRNEVTLDPHGLSFDVELEEARAQVVPRSGAIIPVKFKTASGKAVLLQLSQDDGTAVPFGAEVKESAGKVVGYVGQEGRAFVRLSDENGGQLSVTWSDSGHCTFDVRSGAATSGPAGLSAIEGRCHAN